MVTQTQLARIQAPLINDATYVEDLNNAFEVINENFKKLSSMPFLQGVQGDSYQVITKNIWDTSGAIWIITEDGALLLNSIFGISTISVGDSFDKCKNLVGNTYEGFSPLDFYGTGRGTEITNNILYFQTIIDDSGNENEQSRIIGQYYYFIDGRLKQLGNLRESGILNSSFEDFSGFYRYTYNEDEHTKLYEKVDMLPTIYYDAERNDICWKFFGQRTGISAIGAPGEDGKSASFSFVKVEVTNSTPSSPVTGVADFDHDNTETSDLWVDPTDENLKEGFSFIFIYRSNYPLRYAFGEVRGSGSTWMAYWDNQSVLEDFSTLVTMNDFFDKIGFNYPNGSRKSIEIHAAGTGTSSNTHRHTIGTVFNGDINEYNNNANGAGNLLFRRKLDTDGGRAPDGKSVVFDNYTVKVQKYGDSSNSGTGKPTNEKYTEIKNTGVYIYPSMDVAFKTKIEGDSAIFGGSVEVKNGLNISSGGAIIKGGIDVTGNASIKNGLDVIGDIRIANHIVFNNNGSSGGNSINVIAIEEKSGTNRHLDIKTDGLYLYKTQYGGTNTGKVSLNVDGSINTIGGGGLHIDGLSTFNNSVKINNTLESYKAIINSAKLSLEYRTINESSCNKFNRDTYGPAGNDRYNVNIWVLKETEKVYQVLHFDEKSITGSNALAIPSTYPAWSTVMVLFNDKSNQHFNFIKKVNSGDNKILRVNNNDMGLSGGAIYFICLGSNTYNVGGRECREINTVYRFSTSIF